MDRKAQLFILLLRLGIGTIKASDKECEALLALSMGQWQELMELADRQGMNAIVFDGAQRIFEVYSEEIRAAKDSQEEWIQWVLECGGIMNAYEQLSLMQRRVIGEVAETLHQNGIRMVVFKGQANASLYPVPIHRAKGDIDCYLFGEADKGDSLLKGMGAKVENNWYRHSKVYYHGETIENHRVLSHTRGSKTKKRMERELLRMLQSSELKNLEGCGRALMPTAQFNACFLIYHALHHFTSEGLKMKQITDWAMFLKECQGEVDWKAFNEFCKRYKLERFASAMNYIAIERLGIVPTTEGIVTDGTYADRILRSTLYDDENLFNSGKSDWTVRYLLVKNMLTRDRWKYRDIAQQNVLHHLWENISGYLFERE